MRIAYLHQYFNTPEMVGSTRSYEFAKRLASRGHTVRILTSERDVKGHQRRRWRVEHRDGIEIHWMPVPYGNHMRYRSRIRAFLSFAWHATWRTAGLPSEIVFATSTPLTIVIPGLVVSFLKRIPMVFEARDLWPEVPIALGVINSPGVIWAAKLLERIAYRGSTHIVALSPGMRDGVAEIGYPSSKITVIPNACDIKFFDDARPKGHLLREQHPWLGDRPLVAYVGTLGFVNGVSHLVDIAAEMKRLDPEVRFVIVGDGAERDDISSRATAVNVLGSTLYMFDSVPKNEVPNWIGAADITVSLIIDEPALWHNSANKFFDSLAAGVPIAINHLGWQAEMLSESGAGLVIPAKDAAMGAAVLREHLRDGEWLHKASRSASYLARTEFDREVLAGTMELTLLNAIEEGRQRTRLTPVSS